jgi:hypothetical protein
LDKWLDNNVVNVMSQSFFDRAVQMRKRAIARQRKESAKAPIAEKTGSSGGGAAKASTVAAGSGITSSAGGGAAKASMVTAGLQPGKSSSSLALDGGGLYHVGPEEIPSAEALPIHSNSCGIDLDRDPKDAVKDSGGVRFFYSNFFVKLFGEGVESVRR